MAPVSLEGAAENPVALKKRDVLCCAVQCGLLAFLRRELAPDPHCRAGSAAAHPLCPAHASKWPGRETWQSGQKAARGGSGNGACRCPGTLGSREEQKSRCSRAVLLSPTSQGPGAPHSSRGSTLSGTWPATCWRPHPHRARRLTLGCGFPSCLLPPHTSCSEPWEHIPGDAQAAASPALAVEAAAGAALESPICWLRPGAPPGSKRKPEPFLLGSVLPPQGVSPPCVPLWVSVCQALPPCKPLGPAQAAPAPVHPARPGLAACLSAQPKESRRARSPLTT